MKRLFLILLLPLALFAQTRSVINTGTTANDGTGDSLRTSFLKVNTNFNTLWATVYTNGVTKLGSSIDLGSNVVIDGGTSTYDFTIQDLDAFSLEGVTGSMTGFTDFTFDGQRDLTIYARTNLFLWTPQVWAQTALPGQVLTLRDETTGQTEFQSVQTDTLATLKAIPAAAYRDGAHIRTLGYYAVGDGGGALYRYDSGSSATANDGSVVTPTHGTGRFILVPGPTVNLLSWGLRLGDSAQGSNNAVRLQAAVVAYKDGGHIVLPSTTSTLYLGPNPVRPATHVTNLNIELHGKIEVPATATWNFSSPGSLFHFDDSGSYNNLRIFGTASIWGNATNQTSASTNNFGKLNCFRIKGATNVSIEGLTIAAFGNMAVQLLFVDNASVTGLTIDQTHGNNDTYPTRWGVNSDGIHVYDSRNVKIQRCDIQSTDDCIAFTQGTSSTLSTNYIAIGNILRPYAATAANVCAGIRVGIEPGITNSKIQDVILTANVIKPVGANGIYVGLTSSGVTRDLARIRINNTIIHGAGEDNTVNIGPNTGTTITHSALTVGGMYVVNADDVYVEGVQISNARGKGIGVANVGKLFVARSAISNILDATTGASPRGSAIHLAWGLYGNVDEVHIADTTFEGLDGGGIFGDGSTYQTTRMRITGCLFNNWLRGLYSSGGRSYPAILGNRSLTNYIINNRFVNGEGSAIVINSHSTSAETEIANNSFPFLIPSAGSGVGGIEPIRVTMTGTATGGKLVLTGNRIGEYPSRAVAMENLAEAHVLGNWFTPRFAESTVSGEMVYANFVNASTGNAVFVCANNVAHIGSKGGSNPSIFARVYNNNGSSGSSVSLTSLAAQNILTPASGMAHFVDAFAGGARELAYSANVTVPNTGEVPIRHRIALTGNVAFTWSNPSPGQRGVLDVYPDTSARTVTLESRAYSPTGSSITVNGGTGSTNWTRLMWEVHQVGGTNRILVSPTEVYR